MIKKIQIAKHPEMLFPKGEKIANDKFTETVFQVILSDEEKEKT